MYAFEKIKVIRKINGRAKRDLRQIVRKETYKHGAVPNRTLSPEVGAGEGQIHTWAVKMRDTIQQHSTYKLVAVFNTGCVCQQLLTNLTSLACTPI